MGTDDREWTDKPKTFGSVKIEWNWDFDDLWHEMKSVKAGDQEYALGKEGRLVRRARRLARAGPAKAPHVARAVRRARFGGVKHQQEEEDNGRRSTRLWMPVFAVIISFGVLAAVPAESAQGNKIPSGGKTAMALWALEVAADTLAVLWGSDDVVIARFFEIPMSEYERWPERWQNVLKEVHAAPEKFRRRTIHTLKMFDSADLGAA